jgi:predicted Zn-dependent peptidase
MYNLTTLSNGIRLITAPLTGAKTTAVLVIFSTGSKHETAKQKGLSHFLEHMMFKGTEKRQQSFDVTADLDSIGAEYNAFTSKEYTGYWIHAAHQQAEYSLEILSDMILHSKFDAEEIKRESGVIIEELNMYLDDPKMYIDEVFENLLYGNCPAGWDVIGTKPAIKSFGRKDFVQYHQSQYVGKNCFVVIAGKLPNDVKQLVTKYFKTLPDSKGKTKLKVVEKQATPAVKLQYKATDQAHLLLGVRTMAMGHKDEHILKIISIILGGGLSSRLGIEIREKHGLSYYVRTDHEKYSDTGYMATRCGVPIDKVEKAMQIILAEYKRIAMEPVSDQELERVKKMITGRSLLSLESSANTAQWYGLQAVILNEQKKPQPVIAPDKSLEIINNITVKDIQRVAKVIFVDKRLNLALIGPFKDAKPFKKLLQLT